jgi:hypothetical protein
VWYKLYLAHCVQVSSALFHQYMRYWHVLVGVPRCTIAGVCSDADAGVETCVACRPSCRPVHMALLVAGAHVHARGSDAWTVLNGRCANQYAWP